MSNKGNRIDWGDKFAEQFLTLESEASLQARDKAIKCLGELPEEDRAEAEQRLVAAICAFVVEIIDEEKAPPSEALNRVHQIIEQARYLDELITGRSGANCPPGPLPAVRQALTAPSSRETGKENIATVQGESVTYHADAPVVAAIENIRAIERWARASLPKYKRRVKKRAGGRQSGAPRAGFLSAVGHIYFDAREPWEEMPTLSYDAYSDSPYGAFFAFTQACVECLAASVTSHFFEIAPGAKRAITKLINSPGALSKALARDCEMLKQGRAVKAELRRHRRASK